MENSREFDIVIFGASGYTGRYVVEELASSTKGNNIRWAVAGRSEAKLKASLELVQQYLGSGIDITGTKIIKANAKDEESIFSMCKRAKLILNCVGPYNFYGEGVVAACIENGTHHVDISAEIKYLETTQANYFHAAQEKNVYIVQACGLGSLPADLGILMLKNKFQGDLNSVEAYIEIGEGPEGRSTNVGTFMSVSDAVKDLLSEHIYERLIKDKLFKKNPVTHKYLLAQRLPLFYSDIVKAWCICVPGLDERVIKRTQMFYCEFLNERPIQMRSYITMRSLPVALRYLFFTVIFLVFSMFSLGTYLLANYPSFLTGGVFSKSGPTRKQVETGFTNITLVGKGWKDKLAETTDEHTGKPDTTMKLKIHGPEAAYALTSICMVSAGLTILEETNKLPFKGGVLTPGAAFEKTSLPDRLKDRGVTFTFI